MVFYFHFTVGSKLFHVLYDSDQSWGLYAYIYNCFRCSL